jgi:hypothetical protein
MNYYGPREKMDADRKGSGIWHYTVANDDRVYPVGYCAEGCPGHDTPEGALAHQTEWERDHITFRESGRPGEWHECGIEGCSELTRTMAEWGTGGAVPHLYVCDQHANRETVAPMVSAGIVTSSW